MRQALNPILQLDEKIIAVVKAHDEKRSLDYLDITIGFNEGMDSTYWKDGYKIRDSSGSETLCCPGLIYPRTLTNSEVWSRIGARLTEYVFLTPPGWRPDLDKDIDKSYTPPQIHKPTLRDEKRIQLEEQGLKIYPVHERCAMCADREKYWAVSPPVFLSKNSRRWHVHADCLQQLLPRRQFGLEPVEHVDFV
ncbi:hypothetical protein H0H92_012036 [Tricholoma furcatifolium]|nr:hypothetical protein H0H92_012036 [Tricholoma furcatifolium]